MELKCVKCDQSINEPICIACHEAEIEIAYDEGICEGKDRAKKEIAEIIERECCATDDEYYFKRKILELIKE